MRKDEWQIVEWTKQGDYAILHINLFCKYSSDSYHMESYQAWARNKGTMIQTSAETKKCRNCKKPIPEHIILQWKLIYDGE